MHIFQAPKVKCNLRDSNLRDAAHIEAPEWPNYGLNQCA